MRVEPHTIGSVVHVVKRGARGIDITRDDSDRWRFTRNIYFLNDVYQDVNWARDIQVTDFFERPEHWPERDPLVAVLAWTLMSNHFHLLLCEVREGGVAKFMQRLCGSMSSHFNKKYQESGSLFQGSYRSRTVNTNAYLQYVLSYIVVKNVLELYPGGLPKAIKNFDQAWQWMYTYPFSSFQTVALKKQSPIIDKVRLNEFGLPGRQFKQNSYDMLFANTQKQKVPHSLLLEDW